MIIAQPNRPSGSGESQPILILTALPIEAEGARKELAGRGGESPIGVAADVAARIVVVHTGAGKSNAAAGLERALTQYRPRGIVCGGVAGSLNPALPPGTTVLGRRCWYYDRDATAVGAPLGAVEPSGTDRFDIQVPEHLTSARGFVVGTIATGDSVVTPALLESLPAAWRERLSRSDAVDMESAVWAERALSEGIPIIVARTIYDAIGFSPTRPMSFRAAATQSGATLARLAYESAFRDQE